MLLLYNNSEFMYIKNSFQRLLYIGRKQSITETCLEAFLRGTSDILTSRKTNFTPFVQGINHTSVLSSPKIRAC